MTRRLHILPLGDLDLHSAQEHCWCQPWQKSPSLFVHHAKDLREARERLTGQKASPGWVMIAEYFDSAASDRLKDLERFARCAVRAFGKYLNTTETRILKRAATRLGITKQ